MRPLLRLALLLGLLAVAAYPRASEARLLVRQDGRVLVPVENGSKSSLEQWSPGNETPDWTLAIRGVNVAARSAVAAMAELPDGKVLVVERQGGVFIVDAEGRQTARKQIIYQGLKVENLTENLAAWSDHIVGAERTSAAAISGDNVILASTDEAYVVSVAINRILAAQSDTVFLGGGWYLRNADGPETIWLRYDEPYLEAETFFFGENSSRAVSAVTICGKTLIAGHEDGTLTFQSYPAHDQESLRIRRIHDDGTEFQSILDVGCIGTDLAFSVTWYGAHGQAQVWDLSSMALIDEFGIGSTAHPGMAYSAVASADAAHLMTVGDLDIRLWTIKNAKLGFMATHWLHTPSTTSYSGAALPTGDFLAWDGVRIWQIPPDGRAPRVYAGPPATSR